MVYRLDCSSGGTPVIQCQVMQEGVTQLVKMVRWLRRQEEGKVRGVRSEGRRARERRICMACSASSKGKARQERNKVSQERTKARQVDRRQSNARTERRGKASKGNPRCGMARHRERTG